MNRIAVNGAIDNLGYEIKGAGAHYWADEGNWNKNKFAEQIGAESSSHYHSAYGFLERILNGGLGSGSPVLYEYEGRELSPMTAKQLLEVMGKVDQKTRNVVMACLEAHNIELSEAFSAHDFDDNAQALAVNQR